nr:hypothetical protein CFP56_05829 [Quercus suber]
MNVILTSDQELRWRNCTNYVERMCDDEKTDDLMELVEEVVAFHMKAVPVVVVRLGTLMGFGSEVEFEFDAKLVVDLLSQANDPSSANDAILADYREGLKHIPWLKSSIAIEKLTSVQMLLIDVE